MKSRTDASLLVAGVSMLLVLWIWSALEISSAHPVKGFGKAAAIVLTGGVVFAFMMIVPWYRDEDGGA